MKISSVVVELPSDRHGIAYSCLHDFSLQHVKQASDPLYRGDRIWQHSACQTGMRPVIQGWPNVTALITQALCCRCMKDWSLCIHQECTVFVEAPDSSRWMWLGRDKEGACSWGVTYSWSATTGTITQYPLAHLLLKQLQLQIAHRENSSLPVSSTRAQWQTIPWASRDRNWTLPAVVSTLINTGVHTVFWGNTFAVQVQNFYKSSVALFVL